MTSGSFKGTLTLPLSHNDRSRPGHEVATRLFMIYRRDDGSWLAQGTWNNSRIYELGFTPDDSRQSLEVIGERLRRADAAKWYQLNGDPPDGGED
jgi:hypothetical protein